MPPQPTIRIRGLDKASLAGDGAPEAGSLGGGPLAGGPLTTGLLGGGRSPAGRSQQDCSVGDRSVGPWRRYSYGSRQHTTNAVEGEAALVYKGRHDLGRVETSKLAPQRWA